MVSIGTECAAHTREYEIVCKSCGSYLCPECITDHGAGCAKPKYVHVLHYAADKSMSKLDELMKYASSARKQQDKEFQEALPLLKEVGTLTSSTSQSYDKIVTRIQKLVSTLLSLDLSSVHSGKAGTVDLLRKFRTAIELDIKKRHTAGVMRTTMIVEKISETLAMEGRSASLLECLHGSTKVLKDAEQQAALASFSSGCLLGKLRLMGMAPYIKDWKFNVLPETCFKSEDGLQIMCNVERNDMKFAVGDTPISSGFMDFDVRINNFSSNEHEGFGIIDSDKYQQIIKAGSTDAANKIQKSLIGYMHKNRPRNMRSMTGKKIRSGRIRFFRVRVNMQDFTMKMSGEGLELQADLMPGTEYVPCVIMAHKGSQITFTPLEEHEEAVAVQPEKETKKDTDTGKDKDKDRDKDTDKEPKAGIGDVAGLFGID